MHSWSYFIKHKNVSLSNNEKIFLECCKQCNVVQCKWILNNWKISNECLGYGLCEAFKHTNIEMIDLLYIDYYDFILLDQMPLYKGEEFELLCNKIKDCTNNDILQLFLRIVEYNQVNNCIILYNNFDAIRKHMDRNANPFFLQKICNIKVARLFAAVSNNLHPYYIGHIYQFALKENDEDLKKFALDRITPEIYNTIHEFLQR